MLCYQVDVSVCGEHEEEAHMPLLSDHFSNIDLLLNVCSFESRSEIRSRNTSPLQGVSVDYLVQGDELFLPLEIASQASCAYQHNLLHAPFIKLLSSL
eukprot:2642029-Amphidinium_carterae.1